MSNPQHTLPDSRPYPTDPVKNQLLVHAGHIAANQSGAQRKLAEESLHAEIYMMLKQNFYLNLSVAMSMAPNSESYRALLNALDSVLQAKEENEFQWFALPVVLVAGCNQEISLPLSAPSVEISACLANYPHLRILERANWLPSLVTSKQLAEINAGQWFNAKLHQSAAEELAQKLNAVQTLNIPSGQSVHVLYALGYGDASIIDALNGNLREAALPLMQVWQQALSQPGLTLFTNPLSPATPLCALTEGNHMRLRMALDVFAANAIRAIRLQSPRVGVVMASQGGQLLFGFNATDSQFELQPQVFSWPLSPSERIETVQRDFLDLMMECRVENIRLLHDVLHDQDELPNYAQALKLPGHNPLFAEEA